MMMLTIPVNINSRTTYVETFSYRFAIIGILLAAKSEIYSCAHTGFKHIVFCMCTYH